LRVIADGFHDEPAGNVMALSKKHSRNDIVLPPWKDIKSIICLLTEWTLKASRLFKADSMLWLKRVPVR